MSGRLWLAESRRVTLLVLLGAALVLLSVVLAAIGAPLVTVEAPAGIVSFEFAGTDDAAARMVASWDARAREAAHLVLGVDALYLVVYPAWLSLACFMLARRSEGPWAVAGGWVARAVWLAAPLDAIENTALLGLLAEDPRPGLAAVAAVCAAPKFALVGVAVAYLLVGIPLHWARRRRSVAP